MANNKKGTIKVLSFNINPIFILVAGVILTLVVGAMFNSGGPANLPLSVTELIGKIKQNELSRLQIQNTGEILAQPKYIFVSEAKGGLTPENVREIDTTQLLEILTPKDTLTQIRALFASGGIDQVEEVIIAEDFVVVRMEEQQQDLLVKGVSRAALELMLASKGLDIAELTFPVSDLAFAGKSTSTDSLIARNAEGEFTSVYQVGANYYARVDDEKLVTYSLNWDEGISAFARTLQEEGVELSNENVAIGSVIVTSVPWGDIISLLTLIGFIVLGFFIFRGIQSSGSGLMRFGQSKARMFWGVKPDVTFKDVAGVDEAKQELVEIVQFLRTPEKFRKLGARIPKGVLMVGSPGTGKTLLARAVAGEAGVPFFHTSGSEFEEMLVGAGASRVRDLFEKAKKAAPALIFIDEIDAVARKRGTTIQSSTTEQTLNQILVEMDGFETGTNVIVIAATNRPDVLDPAILRPGRFDRRVVLDLPDVEGRKQILMVHAQGKPLAKDVELDRIAKRTIGFSGAELENMLNEAAIIAAKEDRHEITASDIEEAASKVTMGPVRRSIVRTEEELQLVAVHEAGHALVAKLVEGADPVHRISILSRGSSGGVTQFLPESDNRMISKRQLLARIAVGLGGRAAEEVVLNDISTGASSDIQMVTSIAKAMIQKYGMSEKLGLVKYGESDELEHLGYSYGQTQDYSENTSELIDNEIRMLVDNAYEQAKKLIRDNRKIFDRIVELLREREVLEAEEFANLFA
jgi:cell division protease FtsH